MGARVGRGTETLRCAVRKDLATGCPRQLPQGAGMHFLPRQAKYAPVQTQSVAMPTAWDNGIAVRFMPKRYTSRELVKLAEEFGWILVGVRGDHHNFKHPASRFIVTIVHPQKDVPVGRAVDTVKKIKLELK
jgi:predicted RNA binding protein YcfA (HicA-like mRNA interferase family)